MGIPNWLKHHLKESELKLIEQAVKSAELKTSGEVVPIVVRRSSTVGHVPLAVLLLLTAVYFLFDLYHRHLEWQDLHPAIVITAHTFILFALTWAFSSMEMIQRGLTPRQDQVVQVEQRAINEFYEHNIHRTRQATGILIYLSLLERQAVVLADNAISSQLPKETWDEVVRLLILGIKKQNLCEGLCEAIKKSGELLAAHFPIQTEDTNELKNHLIIKE